MNAAKAMRSYKSKRGKPNPNSLHIDLEDEDAKRAPRSMRMVVREERRNLLSEGLSTPILLGMPSSTSPAAHSSYADKHHKSRKTYEASSSVVSSSKKGKRGPHSSSKERIKDMVSPGVLKALTPARKPSGACCSGEKCRSSWI